MARQLINNTKLGAFVISGIVLLVVSLYLIGQNRSFFGSRFLLKTRFKNVNGLMVGNNVRFSGIQCGTVKDILILEDTVIEVTMLVNAKTSRYIKENAFVEIGNEGLMGNKVVNIIPNGLPARQVEDGGMLQAKRSKEFNDMLGTLSNTNDNAADISETLKEVARKINNSPVLWALLSDTTISGSFHETLVRLRNASANIENGSKSIDQLLADVRSGKGAAGVLLSDKNAAADISQAISNINQVSVRANDLIENLNGLVGDIQADVSNGNGVLRAVLKDPSIVNKLNNSLDNLEKGTASFGEDMEALKHNFLLRGYFRRLEKKNKK